MKYPECCYRIGNMFRAKSGYIGSYNYQKDEGELDELVAITAETLAELAMGENDWISINFDARRITVYWKSESSKTTYSKKYFQEYYEKEFNKTFLRVAKERKYLT